MEKTVEIPEGYEARIESNKVILEPKENEDERVRKAIKMYVEDMPDTFGFAHGIVKEDMLAYLERQKEQKAIEGVIKNITKNKEAATKFLKSAGIMDENGELAKMYRSEQKPAEWSEEDEKRLKACLDGLDEAEHANGHVIDYEREKSWLKSLRSKPHWKPSEKQIEVFFKATPVNLMPEELSVYKSLCSDIQKLM